LVCWKEAWRFWAIITDVDRKIASSETIEPAKAVMRSPIRGVLYSIAVLVLLMAVAIAVIADDEGTDVADGNASTTIDTPARPNEAAGPASGRRPTSWAHRRSRGWNLANEMAPQISALSVGRTRRRSGAADLELSRPVVEVESPRGSGMTEGRRRRLSVYLA
jgi:hypothetical protein